MKLNLDLVCASSEAWLDAVLQDFDSFLQDHANCERKASSMAMSFVAKYPNRVEILPELIAIGIEELEHFQEVYEVMAQRGLLLPHSIGKDPYVSELVGMCRDGRRERFLDRLLLASAVETRGAERFRLVAEHHPDPEMAKFYKHFWTSEAKHGHVFVKMALEYFEEEEVYPRLRWWMEREAEVLQALPIQAALH
jgi:tRNA-(ms[2]io[6]A)-hydroxylase